ncbi:hypothetical protein [Egicoccus halophilus]|uniref:Uncharacterized protein n=1 Tax=Egicoccus halophilus TaxID=1670830 RepID=A0A8J3ADE2_9ACTN|nr:hypothetical protein [Egicoccus halophilus]GGI05212.1 hypothetical protein GCM10011354_12970 [Egicoccus halophilus]
MLGGRPPGRPHLPDAALGETITTLAEGWTGTAEELIEAAQPLAC